MKEIIHKPGAITRWFEHDISLNLGFRESGIRAICGIVLVFITALVYRHGIYYIIPITVYLYISAMAHFCVFKYIWVHMPAHSLSQTRLDWPSDLATQIDPSLG